MNDTAGKIFYNITESIYDSFECTRLFLFFRAASLIFSLKGKNSVGDDNTLQVIYCADRLRIEGDGTLNAVCNGLSISAENGMEIEGATVNAMSYNDCLHSGSGGDISIKDAVVTADTYSYGIWTKGAISIEDTTGRTRVKAVSQSGYDAVLGVSGIKVTSVRIVTPEGGYIYGSYVLDSQHNSQKSMQTKKSS